MVAPYETSFCQLKKLRSALSAGYAESLTAKIDNILVMMSAHQVFTYGGFGLTRSIFQQPRWDMFFNSIFKLTIRTPDVLASTSAFETINTFGFGEDRFLDFSVQFRGPILRDLLRSLNLAAG